jgi:hypothetical protein
MSLGSLFVGDKYIGEVKDLKISKSSLWFRIWCWFKIRKRIQKPVVSIKLKVTKIQFY